jgi:CheY-like chemotaxis protein
MNDFSVGDLMKKLNAKFRPKQEPALPPVLCADDDPSICRLVTLMLERHGFRVEVVHNGREALERIENNEYAAILLDLQIPYVHGATVLALLRQRKPAVLRKLIVMSALNDAALKDVYGVAAAVIRKPITDDALLRHVQTIVGVPVEEIGDLSATAHV